MLLQAEWHPVLQCFVKCIKSDPNESDGIVFPMPTWVYYNRDGVELEGSEHEQKSKLAKRMLPYHLCPQRGNISSSSVFSTSSAAASIAAKMKKADTIMDSHFLDSHFLDSIKIQRPPSVIRFGKDIV